MKQNKLLSPRGNKANKPFRDLFFKMISSAGITGLVLAILISGCSQRAANTPEHPNQKQLQNVLQEMGAASADAGNKRVHYPAEDPGAPLYVRMSPLSNQLFFTDGWLVMPFHRQPACIRPDFNLLALMDVPAAFGCALTTRGYYIIEKDAPLGTFPIMAQSTGTAVPFWFVNREAFEAIAADGVVTIGDIMALAPLKGTATDFKETLRPRLENHHVQINAKGVLDDGRAFSFHVTHVGEQTRSIGLEVK